ncbi:MAG: hypothetical protein ACQGVK_21415 [Myxococcota bacterium]
MRSKYDSPRPIGADGVRSAPLVPLRRSRLLGPALLAAVGLLCAPLPAVSADGPEPGDDPLHEVIDMSPEDRVGWSMRNVFAPITGLFMGGPGYWYKQRRVEVETTPPGGMVDLFYVRANFQKRFEQAEAPVTVLLPKRIEAGPRDSLTIRAFREGYRQKSVTIKMSGREDEVVIDLEPLPNTLAAFSHRYFAGRSSLSFITEELLEFRVQEAGDGFTVVLNETARSPEATAAMEGVRSPMIDEVFGQQLGEDLIVQVALAPRAKGRSDVRSKQNYDAARDLYEFTVDLVPGDGGAAAVQAAIDALGAIRSRDVTGCALEFDGALRARLDAGALNRALTPSGDFTDRYVRAAMRRLGEVTPGGAVRFSDGSRYDPTVPIELEAALSQAGGAEGFLALLRRFVGQLEAEEYELETLRSLIAPELEPARFADAMDESEAAEKECRGPG